METDRGHHPDKRTIGLVRGVEKFGIQKTMLQLHNHVILMLIFGYGKVSRPKAEKSVCIFTPTNNVTVNLNKIKKAQRELSQLNGEMPNVFQLSDYLGLLLGR